MHPVRQFQSLTRFALAVLALCALAGSSVQAEEAVEHKPFVAGTEWRFRTGFFNEAQAALLANRSLKDITTLGMSNFGVEAGVKIWKVTAQGAKVILGERYDYPEDSKASEAVKSASPPSARSYDVVETKSGDVIMNTLVADRGNGAETMHILPVKPQTGQEWHWSTATATFTVGPIAANDPSKDTYNAHGKIVALGVRIEGLTAVDEFKSCTQVELEVDGVKTTWWWDPAKGLVRFGGVNLGLTREKLAIKAAADATATAGPTADHLMDQLVFIRDL